MEHGKAGTTAQAVSRLRWSLFSRYAVLLLSTVILGGLLTPCFADEPAPDPSGTATGDRTTTTDAAGNPFVVPVPPDPSAPDYAQKKKDYDDFQAQLAKEPLAGKLADNVGHVRIATNFSWTLNTGYLVLFMQAGFALADLRTGAQEERRAPDDAELRGVRFRVPRLLRRGIRLPVRRRGHQCRAGQSRRHSNAQSLSAGQRPVGIPRRQGLFPHRPGLRCRQQLS